MGTNCLEVTVDATHESLRMRLEEATRHRRTPRWSSTAAAVPESGSSGPSVVGHSVWP
jgi:hypothetical protein